MQHIRLIVSNKRLHNEARYCQRERVSDFKLERRRHSQTVSNADTLLTPRREKAIKLMSWGELAKVNAIFGVSHLTAEERKQTNEFPGALTLWGYRGDPSMST